MLQLGPLFTMKVMGQRLTFVTDASDISVYYSLASLDFQQAVQKPVCKAGKFCVTLDLHIEALCVL